MSKININNFFVEFLYYHRLKMAIRDHILFKNLENHIIDEIKLSSLSKSYNKNELVYLQEDEARYIYYVKSGWVKLFSETIDGEEAIIDILPTGHVFGDQAILHGSEITHSAESVEKTELILFKIDKVRDILSKSSTFALNMLELLTQKQKSKDRELEHLSLQTAPQRIGCFLLRLCKPDETSNINLNLPYDKSLIASRLGMKAETFSRALNKLKSEANISVNGGKVLISSIDRLSQYCCGACSNTFPCKDIQENAK
jgi:CRP-like cAMP-binding protein